MYPIGQAGIRKLVFFILALRSIDESLPRASWTLALLMPGWGRRGSQDLASHLGRGSLHDDDGPVVEGDPD